MRKLFSILSLVALIFVTSTVVAAARPTHVDVSFSMATSNTNKGFGSPISSSQSVGSSISLASLGSFGEGLEFDFWVINGIVRDDLNQSSSIRLQTKMDVKAILSSNTEHAVVFADSNGKMISLEYVTNNNVTPVPTPNIGGYDKPGLVVNTDQPWKSLDGDFIATGIQSSKVYILQYLPSNVDVIVTVEGGLATPANPKRNQLVTVVPTNEGTFKYWKDASGKVLSFKTPYVFTATKNVTIIAESSDTSKTAESMVTMTNDLAIRNGYETYVAKFELLPGHTLIEWGFLLSQETLNPLTFETENIIIAKSNIFNEASNEFVMSFSNLVFSNIRAYLVIDNGTSFVNIYSFDSLLVSDLIISEYVEASTGNTKVIEIFNGTGKSVDLSRYSVNLYSNGSSTASNTEILSGTLSNGGTFVIANASSIQSVLDIADINSSVTFFNGDDAVALLKDGQVIDLIGVIGVDPGTAWVNGDVSTMDKTLVRKSSVLTPNSVYTASEWESLGTDVFTNLGKHSITPKHITDKDSLFFDINDLTLPNSISDENDLTLKTLGKYGSMMLV